MSLYGLLVFASIYAVAAASPGPGVALIVAPASKMRQRAFSKQSLRL